MNLNSINNCENNLNYKGCIKPSNLYQNYAKEYAKGIKAKDISWKELRQFINTIRAIKADGREDEFIIDIIPGVFSKENWYIKYGSYCNKNESYNSEVYSNGSNGKEQLKKDALRKIVEFGKEFFGLKILNKPIEEFMPANIHLKIASNYYAQSRKPNNKLIAERLISMSKKHQNKAEDLITQIRLNVINQL